MHAILKKETENMRDKGKHCVKMCIYEFSIGSNILLVFPVQNNSYQLSFATQCF